MIELDTWSQLAKELGIDAQKLHNLRRLPESPAEKNAGLWREFLRVNEGAASEVAQQLGDKRNLAVQKLQADLEKRKAEARIKNIEAAEKEKLVIYREDVNEMLARVASETNQMLTMVLETQLPTQAGRTANELRTWGRNQRRTVCDRMKRRIDEWAKKQ